MIRTSMYHTVSCHRRVLQALREMLAPIPEPLIHSISVSLQYWIPFWLMPLSVVQPSTSWTWEKQSHREGIGDGLLSFFCALTLSCWTGCISTGQNDRVLGIIRTPVLPKTSFLYLTSWIDHSLLFNNLLEVVVSAFTEEELWRAGKQMCHMFLLREVLS